MSDELSRRRLGGSPDRQPAAPAGSTGWQTSGADEPLDMNAVRHDDEFLAALSAGMPVATESEAEYQLAGLFAGWRHEVLSAPAPAPPTVDDVERAIVAAQPRPTRKAVRHLRLASGAAAVVVVAAAGLTVLSQGASPGDPLWGVKSVVFASQASQTQAASDAQQNLERAEQAIAAGDTQQAQALVDQAAKDLGPVQDSQTRKQMDDWINRLRSSVTTSAPAASGSPSISARSSSSQSSSTASNSPTSLPPDVRNQLRETTQPAPPETSAPIPSTVPSPPETTPTGSKSTPTAGTPEPQPAPQGPALPPLSIRPN